MQSLLNGLTEATISDLIIGTFAFSFIMFSLVIIVLVVRFFLLSNAEVKITIIPSDASSVSKGSAKKSFVTRQGQNLLDALAEQNIFIPATCGGKGACGQCKVSIINPEQSLLPIESNHISQQLAQTGVRLACMQRLTKDLSVQIPQAMLESKLILCRVVSNQLVSTFLTQLDIEPVDDNLKQAIKFKAGDYLIVEAPPQQIKFNDFNLCEEYRDEWKKYGLLALQTNIEQHEQRAYSLANAPSENKPLRLLVRIATPPPNADKSVQPGKVSSYIFNLKSGDQVSVKGPYGDFHLHPDDNEIMFIGGGAGMAPLRSMIREELIGKNSQRKMSFWYGARSKPQLCYEEEFDQLQQQYQNFNWSVALSEPGSTDNWSGHVGFIHTVVLQQYLSKHPAPESIDYYLCGPPTMTAAVITMLKNLNVSSDHIFNDDFG